MKKITERTWYVALKILLGVLPLVAIFIQIVMIMATVTADDYSFLMDNISTWVLTFGIPILLVIFTNVVDAHIVSLESKEQNQVLLGKIETSASETKRQVEEIKNEVTKVTADMEKNAVGLQKSIGDVLAKMRVINNASLEIFLTYEMFYSRLSQSRKDARKKVRLTQLDPWLPEHYEGEDADGGTGDVSVRQSYFKNDVEFVQKNKNIVIYRIVSIESSERLEWVKKLILETKKCSNFFLAFVDIASIESEVPFPKMLSLQIIDDEEVFCLNPQFSYMPHEYKPCYCFKNKEVAKIYVDYYEAVWNILKSNPVHGCVLKEGTNDRGYEAKLVQLAEKRGWK